MGQDDTEGISALQAELDGFIVHLLGHSDTVSIAFWRENQITWLVNSAVCGRWRKVNFVHQFRQELLWELNPRALAQEPNTIPLDQTAS